MISYRLIVGALVMAAAIGAPTTVQATKHRPKGKASSAHTRRARGGHSETKRRSRDDEAKRRQDAGRAELSEIERRWNAENVEPDLPE